MNSNSISVDLRPQVLYIFEKLVQKSSRKCHFGEGCLKKKWQNIFVNRLGLKLALYLTLCHKQMTEQLHVEVDINS